MAQIAARPIDPQTVASRARLSDLAVLDLSGHTMRYSKLSGKVTVVAFISTRCPMSNAFNSRLNALYNEFEKRVKFVAVNSNANEPLDEVRRHAQNIGYDFPAYKDVNNAMADFLGARATPDAFVIDREGTIAYHGYIEDAPNPERARNHALRLAIEAVLQHRRVLMPETIR
jgi:thiol-disulfide isomerase/thioredoxin